jgi:CRISPR-associated endonuclease/helicase Cas3
MYKLMNLEVLLGNFEVNHKSIWAHTKEGRRSETLLEHSLLCLDYYSKYDKVKGIENIVRNVIAACGCTVEETNIIYDMFVNAIYYHDIGKVNPYYQSRRLNNPAYKGSSWEYDGNPNHALPSAYIYMSEFMLLIPTTPYTRFFILMLQL